MCRRIHLLWGGAASVISMKLISIGRKIIFCFKSFSSLERHISEHLGLTLNYWNCEWRDLQLTMENSLSVIFVVIFHLESIL